MASRAQHVPVNNRRDGLKDASHLFNMDVCVAGVASPFVPTSQERRHDVMRTPNFLIFLFTLILGFVGVWEHFGIPVDIPERALPLIGSTKEIPPFLAAHSFWVVFSAWLLLAIGVFYPRRAPRRGAVLSR
jgi:hypothetical protein